MGDQRNSLRHLGMIATSPSWRRFWWRPPVYLTFESEAEGEGVLLLPVVHPTIPNSSSSSAIICVRMAACRSLSGVTR